MSEADEARKASAAAYEHAANEMHGQARYEHEQMMAGSGTLQYGIHAYAVGRYLEMEKTFRFLASVPRNALGRPARPNGETS